MEENVKLVPVNIWDDYWEDGHVPEGEKQETYMYIETDDISLDDQKEYLDWLLNHMQKEFDLEGIKMWVELYESRKKYPNLVGSEYEHMLFDRWEIRCEGLTHVRRGQLVEELNDGTIPFIVYSES